MNRARRVELVHALRTAAWIAGIALAISAVVAPRIAVAQRSSPLYSNARPWGTTPVADDLSRPDLLFAFGGPKLHGSGLYVKTRSGDWRVAAPNPEAIDAFGAPLRVFPGFYTASSLAGIEPTSGGSWDDLARIYVVQAPGGAPGGISRLYEFRLLDRATGTGSFREVAVPFDTIDLGDSPSVAAGWDGTSAWIAVRARHSRGSLSPAIWRCRLDVPASAGGTCTWQEISGTESPRSDSPVAVVADGPSGSAEFLWIDSTGTGALVRYRETTGSTDRFAIPGRTIVATSIQARAGVGNISVLVNTVSSLTGAPPYRLYLARFEGGGWTGTEIGGGPGAVHPGMNNVFWARDATSDTVWAAADDDPRLWRCILDLAARSCSWGVGDAPQDESPVNDRLGSATWGTTAIGYAPGTLGGVPPQRTPVHLYGWNIAAFEWENHLHPRPHNVVLPAESGLELVAAERYGEVIVVGHDAPSGGITRIWRTTDDGGRWTPEWLPRFPGDVVHNPFLASENSGDESVVFDTGGNAFVTTVQTASRSKAVRIIRRDRTTNAWVPTEGFEIPPTRNVLLDRPWLAASTRAPGVLYLTFAAGTAAAPEGRLAYCAGPAEDCTSRPEAWCPGEASAPGAVAYRLPSLTGCAPNDIRGFNGPAGCWVDETPSDPQTGQPGLWVTVQDDTDCQNPPSQYRNGFWSSVGVHRITNTLGIPCTAPILGAAECIYFIRSVLNPGPRTGFPAQCNGGVDSPCNYRHWSTQFSASRDASGIVSMAVQAAVDLNGAPCTEILSPCRNDMFAIYRDPLRGWCGRRGVPCSRTVVDMSMMVPLNSDQGRSPLLRQEDHVVPAIAMLDYGRFAASWVDFRTPSGPDNARTFHVAQAFGRGVLDGIDVDETPAWPGFAGAFGWSADATDLRNPPRYGDLNVPAGARLHVHLVNSETPDLPEIRIPNPSIPRTSQQSPFTGQR